MAAQNPLFVKCFMRFITKNQHHEMLLLMMLFPSAYLSDIDPQSQQYAEKRSGQSFRAAAGACRQRQPWIYTRRRVFPEGR